MKGRVGRVDGVAEEGKFEGVRVVVWDRGAIVCLQELGGAASALREWLRALGYEAEYQPGEVAHGGVDAHRHGGVMVAWKQHLFRPGEGGGKAGPRRRRGSALLTEALLVTLAEERTFSADAKRMA